MNINNNKPMVYVQTGEGRKSNIELLRIIAMFLVLVVHADYFSLGAPSRIECELEPISSIVRIFFESCSIACVNIFVVISGWFGIRPSLKGFGSFIFQCAYFLFGIYSVMLLTGLTAFSFKGLASCFLCLEWNWFIKAYLCLYILSPVLNSFCKVENRKVMRMVIVAYFLFQTVYGWLTPGSKFFEGGYSTISFIGLYLLARYCKLFSPRVASFRKSTDAIIIMMLVLLITNLEYLRIQFSLPVNVMTYSNPLVIVLSIYVLLLFSKITIQSRVINWIAASSFAVFLLHTNYSFCRPYFCAHVNQLFDSYNGLSCLILIFLYLAVIFIAAIALDQPRKWCFDRIIKEKLVQIDDKY